MVKNDVNKLIQALYDGKIVRRKDGTDRISTRIPIIKVIYTDGTYDYAKENDTYFYNGVSIPINKEIKEVKVVGESSFKVYEVAYYYFNPQCNRCLAKLTNGDIIDHSPSFVDFVWNEYEILDKDNFIPKVTMEEVHAKFGRIVEIVDKNKCG